MTFALELRFRNSQEIEFFGEPERATEDQVTVFDAALRYQLSREVELFLRADNIFDVEYTEGGFRMPRASLYSGVRFSLGTT